MSLAKDLGSLLDSFGLVTNDKLDNPGRRNLIINGDMRVNQRAFASDVDNAYTVDRFLYQSSQGDKFTITQDTDTPSGEGFVNSLKFVTASAVTVGASDYFMLSQPIEGVNSAVLNLGTAGARTFTLSFWTRSSLTGTFGGAIGNSAANRYYPFTYTIDSADTWEHKTVTVAGDTTGTWLTTNGIGLMVRFGLGVGSTKSGTAGAWAAAEYFSATGATSVVGTASATWYLTGVQVEIGSTASDFEHINYDEQEQRCWRYCQINDLRATGWATSATVTEAGYTYSKAMRATPTITSLGGFVRYGPGGQQTPTNVAHTITRWSTQCTQTIGGGMGTNNPTLNAFYFRAEAEL